MISEIRLAGIGELKLKLDALRPLPSEQIKNLDDWYKVELTYNSNAIEGNTLTRAETALVVEKGLTVEGKTLREHLEVINHAEALDYIKELAQKKRTDLTERDLLNMHSLILKRIDDANGGIYRTVDVSISGSDVRLPSPVKVPELMERFIKWLTDKHELHPVRIAVDAHYKLVSIHPFVDGNGRTGRLLMNLLLMQAGFPPAVIRNEVRREYIQSLEYAQKTDDMSRYYDFTYKEIERSTKQYLSQIKPSEAVASHNTAELGEKVVLLKIGELAKWTNETVPTVRFWTTEGLLQVADRTEGGLWLYEPKVVEQIKEIRRLQNEQRLTIVEIKERLKG